MLKKYGLFIDGQWVETSEELKVFNKATGEAAALISVAGKAQIAAAVEAAQTAFDAVKIPPYRRYEILLRASEILMRRQQELAEMLCVEAGKVRKDAFGEIARAQQTLILSAEEAKRLTGDMVPLQGAPGCENRHAYTIRQPLGVVCVITPFNFPVNLACHKIGPALAAGNTVIYKPATATPLTAALLCEIFTEAGLPAGHLNLVTGSGSKVGAFLLAEERVRLYSFTGSLQVGRELLNAAGFRRIALELGSNAANIVCGDVDVEKVAALCAKYAFVNAGQVCISCQRVYVQRSIYDAFCAHAVAYAKGLVVGDPLAPNTDIGPMIDAREAVRAASWIQEAVAGGARILTGGVRRGAWLEPTILTDVTPEMNVIAQEVFAPIFSILPYDEIDEAIAAVNHSNYGLQAGVFTDSLALAHRCAQRLEVGGVIINDGSTFRMDNMPYGGVKESGIGREGPQYAIKEMTEDKLIVFNL